MSIPKTNGESLPVVRASGLCKAYVSGSPARVLLNRLTGRLPRRFEALHDLDFEIYPGECFGVMGPNGSGKSTLLRLITGAFRPTEGQLEVRGRVVLLDLATTFNPDLTGRENLIVSALATGLQKSEIQERLPSILSFSELGESLDNPTRTYSTGMLMRLGFSLFIHTRPDVLLLDEVFAVGDARFILKCVEKIQELKSLGTTIVFVSHDGNAVRELCDRGIALKDGHVYRAGSSMEIVEAYHASLGLAQRQDTEQAPVEADIGTPTQSLAATSMKDFMRDAIVPADAAGLHSQDVEIIGVKLYRNDTPASGAFMYGDTCTVRWVIYAHKSHATVTSGVHLHSATGAYVFGTSYVHLDSPFDVHGGNYYLLGISFKMLVGPGSYVLSVGVAKPKLDTHSQSGLQFDRAVSVSEIQVMQFDLAEGEPVPFFGLVSLPARVMTPRVISGN